MDKQKQLVPKLRFPEFRDSWGTVKLGKCFDNIGGTALEKHVSANGTHHFISIGNYSPEGKYLDKKQRVELNATTKTKLLNKNDLVMVLNDKTSAGDIIGSTLLIKEDNKYIYNQRSERLIVNSNLLPTFAWQLLNSQTIKREIYKRSQGGTQIYVNFPSIKTIDLTIPQDKKEQQKIADCLSSIDESISTQTAKLNALKNHKKALMQQLFPAEGETTPKLRFPEFRDGEEWQIKPLSKVCEINPSVENLPEEFTYVDLESVESGKLIKKKIISLDSAPSRAQRLLKSGDIIFQTVRPYQKNNYFFQTDDNYKYVASTGYAQLRSHESKMYLYQYLYNENFVNRVLTKCSGSNYPAINSTDLSQVQVEIPKLKEQQKIADCLSSIDELITAQAEKIDMLQTHKKGLMQQLFPNADEIST